MNIEKETVDFLMALEEGNLITPDAHKNEQVIDLTKRVISMTEQEHEEFQKENPSQSVLMIFSEYQDWKETYS